MKKLLLLVCVLVIVILGCEEPTEGDTIETGSDNLVVGTWVNPDYDGMGGGPPAKSDIKDDGTLDIYENAADMSPLDSGTYTIVEQIGDVYKMLTIISMGTSFGTFRSKNHL